MPGRKAINSDSGKRRVTIGLQNHALTRRIGPPREMNECGHEKQSRRSTEGVYFIRHPEFIKIGWSKQLAKRQKQHFSEAARWGKDAEVVAVVYGTRANETAIKQYFSDKTHPNDKTEDFLHSTELCDYIRWFRKQHFVEVGEDADNGIVRDVEIVDSQLWLPNSERRISHVPDLFLTADQYPKRELTGDDYYTPEWIMNRVRAAMGQIDLDPASHVIANKVVKAKAFYTVNENGLLRPWFGNVWLNPPFSNWGNFAERASIEWENGNIEMLICLVSATLMTAHYFHSFICESSSIIIPKGRMKFWGPLAGSSPTGHILLAFCRTDEQRQRIRDAFGERFVVFDHELPA